jgi:hypothetical protein
MDIKFMPQIRDARFELIKSGDTLTINGERFDFGRMKDGDTLPRASVASEWFMSDVEKVGDSLQFTMLLPIPVKYSQEQAFPATLFSVPDGPVKLPEPPPDETDQEAPSISKISGLEK